MLALELTVSARPCVAAGFACCAVLQLRAKCLEALVQLLQVAAADGEAVRAFRQSSGDGKSGSAGSTLAATESSSLSATVSSCMMDVSSQDPAAAHKALASKALNILQRFDGV
jgi:hypothetical protein